GMLRCIHGSAPLENRGGLPRSSTYRTDPWSFSASTSFAEGYRASGLVLGREAEVQRSIPCVRYDVADSGVRYRPRACACASRFGLIAPITCVASAVAVRRS